MRRPPTIAPAARWSALCAALLLCGCPEDGAGTADLAAPVDAAQGASRAARWTVIRPPTAGAANLFALYGDGTDRLFAVGSGGSILRAEPDPEGALDRDGRPRLSFSPMASGVSADLTAVHGTSGSDVYAVGLGGTILRYDGAAWQPEVPAKAKVDDPPFTANLWGVFAYSGGAIAVGDGGYWTRRVMGKWEAPKKLQVEGLLGVWGASPTAIWAVGSIGYIFFFDGANWRGASPAGFTSKLAGAFGSAANNVFAVGLGGAILRNGGGGFQDYGGRADPRCGGGSALPKVFLRKGAVLGTGEILVIGWEGVIARLTEGPCQDGGMGLSVFDESGATDRRLEGLWAQRDGQRSTVYISGVEGVVLRGE